MRSRPQRCCITAISEALIHRLASGISAVRPSRQPLRGFLKSLTKNESRKFNDLTLLLVIPAKAGIQKRQGRSGCPWTPAFAGATITGCECEVHFELGSQSL